MIVERVVVIDATALQKPNTFSYALDGLNTSLLQLLVVRGKKHRELPVGLLYSIDASSHESLTLVSTHDRLSVR